MQKKGSIGKAALIYGIVISCIPLLKIFFANNTSYLASVANLLIRIIFILGPIVGIILGIIGLVKKSDTTKAAIGLILSIFGPYVGEIIAIVIIAALK